MTFCKEVRRDNYGKIIQVFNRIENEYYAVKLIPLLAKKSKYLYDLYKKECVMLPKFNCDNISKFHAHFSDDEYLVILT